MLCYFFHVPRTVGHPYRIEQSYSLYIALAAAGLKLLVTARVFSATAVAGDTESDQFSSLKTSKKPASQNAKHFVFQALLNICLHHDEAGRFWAWEE